jgi:hypothetical protein
MLEMLTASSFEKTGTALDLCIVAIPTIEEPVYCLITRAVEWPQVLIEGSDL